MLLYLLVVLFLILLLTTGPEPSMLIKLERNQLVLNGYKHQKHHKIPRTSLKLEHKLTEEGEEDGGVVTSVVKVLEMLHKDSPKQQPLRHMIIKSQDHPESMIMLRV